jgi:hypothetical protein
MIDQKITYDVSSIPNWDVNRSDFEILPYIFVKYSINDK